MAQDPQENPKKPDTSAFSQDDIDALLQGGEAAPDPAASAATEAAAPDADGGQEVDQAAIDALLAGGGEAAEAAAGEESGEVGKAEAEPEARLDSMGRPFDEMAAAMAAAIEEEKAEVGPPTPAALTLEEFGDALPEQVDAKRVSMLNDVNLRVKIELGRTRMLVEEVLKLDVGSVVELERLAGDPVDVYVNERLIARGEILVLNDNFCVRVSEVNSEDPHRVST